MVIGQHFANVMHQAQTLEAQNSIPEALRLYRVAASMVPGHAAPDTKIATLGARQLWGPPPVAREAVTNGSPRVTMRTLGQNGRFGNQIFQYAYLRLYAEACGAQIETGDWIGRDMFELSDPLVIKPPPYLPESSFDTVAALAANSRPKVNVDLVGYFQLPTASFRPHRSKFRALFELRPCVRDFVDRAWETFGASRRPVVALHLRRADFGYGRFWVAPLQWYQRWLETVWTQWTDPILYVATDDPFALTAFGQYRPMHAGILDWFPQDLRFVLDFVLLARSDALAIANSSFSFAAAMLNEHAKVFARPNPSSERLETFDPWDSKPLIDPPWSEPSISPADERIIAGLISERAVIFDANAGKGDWARAVQTALFGRVKIFAFESDPAHIRSLKQWAHLTRPDMVTIVPVTMSGDVVRLRNPGDAVTAGIQVNRTTIDEFCRTRGIRHVNFLKASLTGGELALLQGTRTLLSHARVDFIQFGYGEAHRRAGLRLKHIFTLLDEYDYELFNIGPHIIKAPHWHDGLENYRPADYLAIHSRLTGVIGMGPRVSPDLRGLWQRSGLRAKGVIHVGAHLGEEAENYRAMGVSRMLLIEANPKVFKQLQDRFADKPGVVLVNKAVADANENRRFHVTNFSQSSSLLRLGQHSEIYPQIVEEEVIDVECVRLDDVLRGIGDDPASYDILNIDVQGGELMVLKGAEETLQQIKMLNIEVNFTELYEGCPQIDEIDDFLASRGFRRVALTCPYHPSWGDAVYARGELTSILSRMMVAPNKSEFSSSANLQAQELATATRPRRNEPCPCGSGKRYKHCHGALL
jgi:FkbM family methyltransferase